MLKYFLRLGSFHFNICQYWDDCHVSMMKISPCILAITRTICNTFPSSPPPHPASEDFYFIDIDIASPAHSELAEICQGKWKYFLYFISTRIVRTEKFSTLNLTLEKPFRWQYVCTIAKTSTLSVSLQFNIVSFSSYYWQGRQSCCHCRKTNWFAFVNVNVIAVLIKVVFSKLFSALFL